jgi:hypothetical protein
MALELGVAEGLERAAVDLAGASRPDDRRVDWRDVPDVRSEPVVRVDSVQAAHRTIANHLGDDGRGCDRRTPLVTVHDRLVLGRQRSEPEAVHEAGLRGWAEGGESLAEPPEV